LYFQPALIGTNQRSSQNYLGRNSSIGTWCNQHLVKVKARDWLTGMWVDADLDTFKLLSKA